MVRFKAKLANHDLEPGLCPAAKSRAWKIRSKSYERFARTLRFIMGQFERIESSHLFLATLKFAELEEQQLDRAIKMPHETTRTWTSCQMNR